MKDSPRLLVAFIVVCVVIVGTFLSLPIIDSEVCKQYANARDGKCSANDILLILARPYGEWFRWIEPGLATISAVAIAIFTWRLFVSTDRLWDESKATRETMQANAMRELRAYVSVTMEYEPNEIEAVDGLSSQIIPIWHNSGNTPTRNMKMYVACRRLGMGEANSSLFLKQMAFGQHITIFPRASHRGDPIVITKTDLYRRGVAPFYIWGATEYEDVFDGGPWRTEFCFRVDFVQAVTGVDADISFRPYGEFNRADEECQNWSKKPPL